MDVFFRLFFLDCFRFHFSWPVFQVECIFKTYAWKILIVCFSSSFNLNEVESSIKGAQYQLWEMINSPDDVDCPFVKFNTFDDGWTLVFFCFGERKKCRLFNQDKVWEWKKTHTHIQREREKRASVNVLRWFRLFCYVWSLISHFTIHFDRLHEP